MHKCFKDISTIEENELNSLLAGSDTRLSLIGTPRPGDRIVLSHLDGQGRPTTTTDIRIVGSLFTGGMGIPDFISAVDEVTSRSIWGQYYLGIIGSSDM